MGCAWCAEDVDVLSVVVEIEGRSVAVVIPARAEATSSVGVLTAVCVRVSATVCMFVSVCMCVRVSMAVCICARVSATRLATPPHSSVAMGLAVQSAW